MTDQRRFSYFAGPPAEPFPADTPLGNPIAMTPVYGDALTYSVTLPMSAEVLLDMPMRSFADQIRWHRRRNRNPFPTFDWYPWIGATADVCVRVASTAGVVRERLRLAGMALRGELTDNEEDDW